MGQSAVLGQRGSRNTCLGGSCREITEGEGDLRAPCPKEQGTPVGANKGHPSALLPQFSCALVLCACTMAHRQCRVAEERCWGQPSRAEGTFLAALGLPWCRKLECSDNPGGSDSGRTALGWEKGVEQSGFVWCNPPEPLPAPWGRGGLAQDKLHTHTHTHARWCTQAPRSPSGLAEQGHIHLRRNSPRASHDCSGRHHSTSWGWCQGMHCTTAGTGGHLHLGAREIRMKSAVPWLHPDCSKAAVHAPQHQGLGTLPPLPAPVDSENTLRK